jgi:hypothetical protein
MDIGSLPFGAALFTTAATQELVAPACRSREIVLIEINNASAA